jgi:acyl-CoA synthetase (AMP-forming)/AMP-acid ligase II
MRIAEDPTRRSVSTPVHLRHNRSFLGRSLVTPGKGCPLITTSLPQDDPHSRLETLGRAAPHVELKISHVTDGRQLHVGEVGEMVVRARTMMTSYFGMLEANAAAFDQDGFLHTGDLGSLDESGYLRIHGRARDMIIRDGKLSILPKWMGVCCFCIQLWRWSQ